MRIEGRITSLMVIGLMILFSLMVFGTGVVFAQGEPTADAGSDQTVTTGDTVQLDGSGSSDPEDDTLTYSWTLDSVPAGSSATLSDSTLVNPTIDSDMDGDYVATLVVNDGTSDSDPDSVTITAVANQPPIADAGSDQTVTTGDTVQLDGSGSSDPENDTLTYSWTLDSVPAGSSATLSDSTLVNPTFDSDMDGDYVATLVVNDGTSDSDPNSVTITAVANQLPTAVMVVTRR